MTTNLPHDPIDNAQVACHREPITCMHPGYHFKMINDKGEAHGDVQHVQRRSFTGPCGIGDYRPRSDYVPLEATGDLSYLCRPAPNMPHPMPRRGYVGEIGWGWQYNQLLNSEALLSDMQIKVNAAELPEDLPEDLPSQKTYLRKVLEDKASQNFLNTL